MASEKATLPENFFSSSPLLDKKAWLFKEHLLTILLAIITSILALEFADALGADGLIFLTFYILIIISITIILRSTCNRTYSLLWNYALIIRLLVVLAFSFFSPTDFISYYGHGTYSLPGILFPDEAYYVISAQSALQQGIWSSIDFGNHYERIVAYYAVIMALAGEELIWGRLVNIILTALTSIFIYDSIRRTTCTKVHRFAWWMSAFVPVLMVWSCVYLKEALLVLGVAMLINSSIALSQGARKFRYWLTILIGISLCFFARSAVLILLLPTIAIAFGIGDKAKSKKLLFVIAITTALISIYLITNLFHDVLQVAGRDPFLFIEKQNKIIEGGVSFPFFNFVNGLPGPLRKFGFTLLLMINPIITGVWNILPVVGKPSWMVFAVSSYAITWWSCLPLWLIGSWSAIKRRDGWWMFLASILVIWIFISAMMRYGAGYDAFRYRETFLPLTILLAMRGLHFIYKESIRPQKWWLILKVYAGTVIGLIVLKGIGILSM